MGPVYGMGKSEWRDATAGVVRQFAGPDTETKTQAETKEVSDELTYPREHDKVGYEMCDYRREQLLLARIVGREHRKDRGQTSC